MFKKKLTTILLGTALIIGNTAFSQFSVSAANYNGWKHTSSTWKYLINGDDVKGWLQHNTKWYYFNTSGDMDTGWLLHNGKWYFFGTDGDMKTGWVLHNGKWYYLGEDGAMKTGWLKNNDKWYYLNKDGALADEAWIYYNNNWYYINDKGEMAVNTTTPDGFEIGDDGTWTGRTDKTAAPTNLEASAYSSSVIRLQWDKVDNADYYYVYYSLQQDTGFKAILNNDGTKKKFTWDSGYSAYLDKIAPDTKVYFKVTAVNNNYESKYSTVVSEVTKTGTVTIPANVTFGVISSNKIQVKWDQVIGADSYKVYYKISTAGDYTMVTAAANSYTLTGLDPETKVYFKVKAVKGTEESGYSTEINATTKSE